MRNRLSTILLISILFLLFSPLIDQAYALGSVVDSFSTNSGQSASINKYWDQFGGTCAWVAKTIPNASGTAQSLTLKIGKYGTPTGYYQYDLYDSGMVLRDWTVAQSIALLSGVRKNDKNLAFTQSYSIVNGTIYYVGCRAINGTLDDNNMIILDLDTYTAETAKARISGAWSTYNNCGLRFILYATIGEAKSWHSITWNFTLLTRKWTSIPWTFSLSTKTWNSIEWMFNLNTRSWHSVEWMFELLTREWTSILWIFDLVPHMWHSILWDFVLTAYPVSFPILFVGFAFVFLLAIGLILYYYWEK